jgi:hypothetical protein
VFEHEFVVLGVRGHRSRGSRRKYLIDLLIEIGVENEGLKNLRMVFQAIVRISDAFSILWYPVDTSKEV